MSDLFPCAAVCVGDLFSTGCRAYVRIVRFSQTSPSAHALHSSLSHAHASTHTHYIPCCHARTTHPRIVCEGRIFMISTYARIFSFIQGFFELKNRSAMMVSWWSKDHQKLSTGGFIHFPPVESFSSHERKYHVPRHRHNDRNNDCAHSKHHAVHHNSRC